jgi:hypothetical protein
MKKGILIFIISLAVGLSCYWLANVIYSEDLILAWDRAGIVLGYVLSCLTVGAAVTAAFSLDMIKRWLRQLVAKRRFEGLGTPFDPLREKVEAIVIPVSRTEQPEWIMRHLKPRYVGLVFTEKSRRDAEKLMQIARTLDIEPIFGTDGLSRGLSDPNDPARNRDVARTMIEGAVARGVAAGRIFVDTTGGRVPMTIGLFQAAEEAGVSSIYISGREKDGRIINTKDPLEGCPIFISDHTEDAR